MSDVEETITIVEVDEETNEQMVKVSSSKSPPIFAGDFFVLTIPFPPPRPPREMSRCSLCVETG